MDVVLSVGLGNAALASVLALAAAGAGGSPRLWQQAE